MAALSVQNSTGGKWRFRVGGFFGFLPFFVVVVDSFLVPVASFEGNLLSSVATGVENDFCNLGCEKEDTDVSDCKQIIDDDRNRDAQENIK